MSRVTRSTGLGLLAAILICVSVAQSQVPGICANVPLGAACTHNDYCISGYCDAGNGTSKTGLCMPNRTGQIGDICSHDNQCTLGNCEGLHQNASGAWVPGMCASTGALGATCSQNAKCSSGYCDAGNGTSKTNRCMPNHTGNVGDICSNDNQCTTFVCAGLHQEAGAWVPGACANKAVLGTACSQNYQCGSGYCDTGLGTSKTDRCMPASQTGQIGNICSNDNQCALQYCQGLRQDASGAWIPGACANKAVLGTACSQNYQCGSGYCDAGNGTSKTNRCMPPNQTGQIGDICSNDNQCALRYCQGLRQDPAGAWIPGACANGTLGASCSQNYQCGSGYCDAGNGTSKTNRCMPNHNGQLGDICSNDNQCTTFICGGLHQEGGAWIPGTCANKGALGAACTGNDKCSSGYCDAGWGTSQTNRCMPNHNGGVGDICSNNNQCTTSICAGLHQAGGAWVPGTCASKKMLGDACSQNSQCSSAYCDTGNGTSRTDRCMPNMNGTSGQICSHPNQCTSHNCVGLHPAGGQWIPGTCQ